MQRQTFVIGASNVMDGIRATDSFRIWKTPVPSTRIITLIVFSISWLTSVLTVQTNDQLELHNRLAQSKYVCNKRI